MLARIDACAKLLDNSKRLEAEIFRNQSEIEGLKDDLEAVSIKLHEEKRINLKLNAENDHLRIKDVESQRKISLLLKLCGKTEADIVTMLERNTPVSDSELKKYPKLKQLKEQNSYKQQKSSQSLELEVANMEQQLMDQERLHRTQLKEERLLWRKAEKIHVQDKTTLRDNVSQIQSSLSGLESQIGILTCQLNKQKTEFRKNENKWLNDKSVLVRKIEFFEKYGTMEGTHTEHRLKARMAGGAADRNNKEKMQKLVKEVEAKEREVLRNKEEIHSLKNEIFKEKAKSDAAANILAKKTKSMTEQVNILNDRCQRVSFISVKVDVIMIVFNQVEKRKAVEIEGYQTDIKILRNKLSQLESKLLAVAEVSEKEEENKEILETLRRELKQAEMRRPKQWRN